LFFHVPTTASGIADLPGFNLLVTVGLWDEHVGRPFSRAGTAFHELGHNLELWHGGISPIWGNKGLNTATYIEPQCKPFHLSSMSYLFQVHGLFDDSDAINLDFSGTEHAGAVETGTLSDAALYPAASYLPAWFAPAGSTLAGQLGVSPSTRFCPGKNAGGAAGSMARVYADSSSAFIDWNGDTVNNASLFQQDVNFDGTLTGAPRLLNGFNDWNNIRLDQVGAVATGLIPGSGEDLSKQLGDLAAELAELAAELAGNPDPAVQALAGQLFGLTQNLGGLGQSQGGVGQGLGGIGQALGGIGQALGGIGQALGGVGQGLGGVGQALGGVGQGLGGVGQALGGVAQNQGGVAQNQGGQDELSYTHANELGKSKPYGLTVCVIGRDAGCSTAATFTPNYHRIEGHFNAPPFGDFTSFEVQRRRAAGGPFVTVGTTSTTSFIDLTELADSVFQTPDLFYVYRVRGLAADGNSPWSRLSAPIDPVNNPPVASGDGPFTVDNRGTLTMDVLANDTDDDSPPAFLGRRPLITQQPTSGNLTPNVNGTLTYVPPRNFSGQTLTVTFKYKADDGLSSDTPQVPLSAPSNEEITVTITVFKTK
jgi:hypothetical protein